MTNTEIKFTPEEEKEFTFLNMAAFQQLALKSARTREKYPMWLCMSDSAKTEARQFVMDQVQRVAMAITEAGAEKLIQGTPGSDHYMSEWKTMELEFKRLREKENNPRAFFIP